MKAEDIERLVRESLRRLGRDRSGGSITLTRAHLRSFARACEQHGIARTKAHAGPHVYPSGEFWRALDAEIAKENET